MANTTIHPGCFAPRPSPRVSQRPPAALRPLCASIVLGPAVRAAAEAIHLDHIAAPASDVSTSGRPGLVEETRARQVVDERKRGFGTSSRWGTFLPCGTSLPERTSPVSAYVNSRRGLPS